MRVHSPFHYLIALPIVLQIMEETDDDAMDKMAADLSYDTNGTDADDTPRSRQKVLIAFTQHCMTAYCRALVYRIWQVASWAVFPQ